METRAAVAYQAGQPLAIETVNLEGPKHAIGPPPRPMLA